MRTVQTKTAVEQQRGLQASSRGKASTLHVDLGEDLKAAVLAAAQLAGMRPSDWVRSQLAAAAVVERGGQGRAVPDVEPQRPSADLFASARVHQLTLQPRDVEQLDGVAAAGGFRSRPAALRFVLRQHACADGHAALRQLPQSIPALAESNVTLQAAVRLAAGLISVSPGATLEPALRRDIGEHMVRASRVVAALQPLLAARR